MILIWREDTNPAVWTNARLTNYLDLCDLGLNVTGAVQVPRPFPPSTVEIETRVEPADFFFAGIVFVVSAALRSLLEEFKVNAEFLELKVVQRGKPYKKKKFFFANILDVVQCLDYRKSRYKKTTHGVTGIKKLVIDESKCSGHHLFKVGPIPSPKSNPKAVRDVIECTSDVLAKRVLDLELTGVVFTKPEDRRAYPPPAWKPVR